MNGKVKVFIDGREGTTGLRIEERLEGRSDIEQILIAPELRKDACARKECLNAADIAFLCLPDAAAVEAVSLVTNPSTRIIDTSTAHRTNPEWTYGMAELTGMRARIAESKRIANPGCHASGFVLLVRPLVEKGWLPPEALLTCHSLTGYSGGGKKMIADYETNPEKLLAPRSYGLSQQHKHLNEMKALTGLTYAPIFTPIVSSYYSGMSVNVPLHAAQFNRQATKQQLIDCYRQYYADAPLVSVSDETAAEEGFIGGGIMSGYDDLEILVTGNEDRFVLTARFDNLGKGASGSAVQIFNILTNNDETKGLDMRYQK